MSPARAAFLACILIAATSAAETAVEARVKMCLDATVARWQWDRFWALDEHPEYVAGRQVAVSVYTSVDPDAIGLCSDAFEFECVLWHAQLGVRHVTNVIGGFRAPPSCGVECRERKFDELYSRPRPARVPNAQETVLTEKASTFFNSTEFARGRATDDPQHGAFRNTDTFQWTFPAEQDASRDDKSLADLEKAAQELADPMGITPCSSNAAIFVPSVTAYQDSAFVLYQRGGNCPDAMIRFSRSRQRWSRNLEIYEKQELSRIGEILRQVGEQIPFVE